MILHITPPSKDTATKAMYDRFMSEEFCPFCLDDHVLGYLMGARTEADGYVLTVNITDVSMFDLLNEVRSRRAAMPSARSSVA